jgi:hypothetical protein
MFENLETIERRCATAYADPVYAVIGSRRP